MSHTRQMVIDLNSGRTRPIRNVKPIVSSSAAGWNGILLEESRNYENELTAVYGISHVVVLQLDAPLNLEFRSEGKSLHKTISPGQISIVPANLPLSVRTRTSGRVVTISIDPKKLVCAAAELGGHTDVHLKCLHGIDDPLLREIILGLRSEAVANGSGSKIYAEHMANTLAAHLVYRYSNRKVSVPPPKGGLSKPALQRVIEFVNERFGEDISLGDMAAVAELSPFHFARLFKQSTSYSPHEFVNRCRIEKAKTLLMQSQTISDVALEVGFCDQSHLARHFKRMVGLTPGEFVQQIAQRKKFL